MAGTDKQYNEDRIRKAFKAIAWAAGGGDFISMSGPFNEVLISWLGTTDAHTIDADGISRAVSNLLATSSKRGQVANISGIDLYAIFEALWGNGFYYVDTVGGAAVDGMAGALPMSCDADESINFAFTFGTLADIASAGDLAGYAATVRMSAKIINQAIAETYWAYRGQPLNGTGVVALNTQFQQPLIPIIPGFYLTGEVFTAHITNLQTALNNLTLAQIQVYQGNDPIVDDFVIQLLAEQRKRVYGAITGHLFVRHIPLMNNDATVVGGVNGGVATIAPSRVTYIYLGGTVSQKATVPTVTVPSGGAQGAQGAGIPQPLTLQVGPVTGGAGVLGSLRRVPG